MWGSVWLACLVIAYATAFGGCATTMGATTPDGERSEREFKLAAALRSEGQTASAIEHLHIALELNSNNAEAHLLLGFIQMERRASSSWRATRTRSSSSGSPQPMS
ncbi:MAG: tetratricopeptide repeat protein [Deltaproteobacteria bacterium]|nr:tetratricopeptide repeat protein [Deltaproteobacteria bacterium]